MSLWFCTLGEALSDCHNSYFLALLLRILHANDLINIKRGHRHCVLGNLAGTCFSCSRIKFPPLSTWTAGLQVWASWCCTCPIWLFSSYLCSLYNLRNTCHCLWRSVLTLQSEFSAFVFDSVPCTGYLYSHCTKITCFLPLCCNNDHVKGDWVAGTHTLSGI